MVRGCFDRDTHSHPRFDGYLDPDTDSRAHRHADAFSHRDCYADRDLHTDGDGNADQHIIAYGYRNCHSYAYPKSEFLPRFGTFVRLRPCVLKAVAVIRSSSCDLNLKCATTRQSNETGAPARRANPPNRFRAFRFMLMLLTGRSRRASKVGSRLATQAGTGRANGNPQAIGRCFGMRRCLCLANCLNMMTSDRSGRYRSQNMTRRI